MDSEVKKLIEALEALGWHVIRAAENAVTIEEDSTEYSRPAASIPASIPGRRVVSFDLTLSRKS